MAIEDNNPVNADYTNSQVVNNDLDETLTGIVTLDHDNGVSGSTVVNLQKAVNDLKKFFLLFLDIEDPIDLVSTGNVDQQIDGRKSFPQGTYYGDPEVDGTWRIRKDGADLVHEIRVSGIYEERSRYEA